MAEELNITLEQLSSWLDTSEAAEFVSENTGEDISAGDMRRWQRQGKVPGGHKILGNYVFNPEKLRGFEPPEGRSGGGGAKRSTDDGTPIYRWKLWATKEQIEELRDEGFEIENPRKKARQRRAARKAKEAENENEVEDAESDENPFEGF